MKKEALKDLLYFMKGQLVNSTISGKRNFGDFVADRITQAATKSTLIACIERFGELVGAGASCYPDIAQRFIVTATGRYAPALLLMLRKYPKIVSHMLFVSAKRDGGGDILTDASVFDTMLAGEHIEVLIEDATMIDDTIVVIPSFDVPLYVTCISPLAHGSDSKNGNSTLYRRMEALGKQGTIMSLPFYSGNAVRGQLRNILANHFLKSIDNPKLSLWFFHTLYAGGMLEENSAVVKGITKRLGSQGAVRVEGMRELREMIPCLSLLGAAIGNRIISGRIMVGDLRPRCREWGTGEQPSAELFDWHFLTRHDDNAENRTENEEHHGMIAMTETLKPGTRMDGGIDIGDHASEIEVSVLAQALEIFKCNEYLGAESRRGFGKVQIDIGKDLSSSAYTDFLATRKADILAYLGDIGAIVCTPSA